MNHMITFIFTALSWAIIPGTLFGIIWYLIKRKGWGALRLLALGTAVLIAGGTIVLWFFIRDRFVLILGLLMALIQIVATFFWNKTAPTMIERFKLRK